MHPCLQVTEVLSLVFRVILDPEPRIPLIESTWPIPGSQDLANLALTCKTFNEPAFDILWYFLPNIKPLIRCLPSDAILAQSTDASLSLVRGLESSDLDRFHFYAKRVRVLGTRGIEGEHGLHNLVLPVVLSHRQGQEPLLPNLLELAVELEDFREMAVFPSLVVGPRLQSISIHSHLHHPAGALPEYPWDNVRAILARSLSSITSFTVSICGNRWAFELPQNLSSLIHSLPGLKQLYAPDFTFLSHFAALPKLEMLHISTTNAELLQYLPEPDWFQNLKLLDIRVEDLAPCTRLLAGETMKGLFMLAIKLRPGYDVVQSLDPLLEALNNTCSTSVLAGIDIQSPAHAQQRHLRAEAITPKTIANILPFAKLQHIMLSLGGAVQLDSPTVRTMAMSWPHLRKLSLKEHTIDTVPAVKLGDLAYLTASCPHLERLAMRVDALDPPQHADVGNIVPGRNVLSFNACTSPININSQASITRFIAMIFPTITSLKHGWDDNHLSGHPPEYSEAWGMVADGMNRIIRHNRVASQERESRARVVVTRRL